MWDEMGISNKKSISLIKKLNSREKRRFVQDTFDLDLAYITPRLIAMGYPATGVEAVYRNHMKDVQRFFNEKYSGHYKIYNLCCERKYSEQWFENWSREFIFDDHNAPMFYLIRAFCNDLDNWFIQDKNNVASIHCKAGKGRTGVMIWSYLLYSGKFTKAKDALDFYAYARTNNNKGVTIPSQIRYVNYFGKSLEKDFEYKRVAIKLNKIRMFTIPNVVGGGWCPFFVIKNDHKDKKAKHFSSNNEIKTEFIHNKNFYDFQIKSDLFLLDDIKIEFYHNSGLNKQKMFHFWIHTSFLDKSGMLHLSKDEIDKADRDKKSKVFDKNFGLELHYDIIEKYVISDYNKPEQKYTKEEEFLLKLATKLPRIYDMPTF
jgi:phosphatidylinositol-3,4,5-trisphosphate 3-phosphatase and dual-specificity protein phosphatase PTEN